MGDPSSAAPSSSITTPAPLTIIKATINSDNPDPVVFFSAVPSAQPARISLPKSMSPAIEPCLFIDAAQSTHSPLRFSLLSALLCPIRRRLHNRNQAIAVILSPCTISAASVEPISSLERSMPPQPSLITNPCLRHQATCLVLPSPIAPPSRSSLTL
ncbi:hypothetical protein M0R45_009037 [Rubus argutus]|uniref:Uncharacterized protein n=1 Tax=Rubus argutus TaxID=59490 RepID=A0AAW1Y313_RUBAR